MWNLQRRPHLPLQSTSHSPEALGTIGSQFANMPHGSATEGLPTTHPLRIQMRDAKMWRRETQILRRTGQSTSRCPCTLCLFGKPLLRSTHAIHLRDFGRHPRKRLQPQVSIAMSGYSLLFGHGPASPTCLQPEQMLYVFGDPLNVQYV